MTALRLDSTSAKDTQTIAASVAAVSRPGDMLLLAGDLGAGKTTFTQGFGAALGVTDPITSPTFTLVNHYAAAGGLTVVHADVYRLDRLQEIIDLGLGELVDDRAIAVVEWGDVAEPVLPKDFLEITLAYPPVPTSGDDEEAEAGRTLTFRPVGSSWTERLDALRALEGAAGAADVPGGSA